MKDEERKLWTERINSYRTSGLTAVKWAGDNNISVHKLRSCIAKFNKEKRQISNNESELGAWVSLIPTKSIGLNETIKPLKVTIGLATIEVTSGFDQDTCKMQAQQIEELTAKLNWYEEQFRLSQQKRFGTSSEQTDSNQLSIFNEAEKESRPEKEEPTIEEITYKRKKKQRIK